MSDTERTVLIRNLHVTDSMNRPFTRFVCGIAWLATDHQLPADRTMSITSVGQNLMFVRRLKDHKALYVIT
jgi:hypothetical protein